MWGERRLLSPPRATACSGLPHSSRWHVRWCLPVLLPPFTFFLSDFSPSSFSSLHSRVQCWRGKLRIAFSPRRGRKKRKEPLYLHPLPSFSLEGFQTGPAQRHGGRERREERRRLPPIRFVLFLFTARNCTQVRTHFQFLGESQS